MLAYVFRHWPSQASDGGDYEALHLQFHRSIAKESPAGFHLSFIFRPEKAPWIAATGPIYEDWYLVENFAALESSIYSRTRASVGRLNGSRRPLLFRTSFKEPRRSRISEARCST